MTTPRVSVIVPAFNVEPYLAQCLDSLIVQDLREIEIIVVNDGSTDETAQIAMRYAESHAKVRLIDQPNMGLSEARNAGMRAAKGEFLGFVDGDDWVHSSMFKELERHAGKTGADLVISNGLLYDDATKAVKAFQDSKVWAAFRAKDCSVALDPAIETDLYLLDTSACRRLYRKAFLERLGFLFQPGKIFEDVAAHYHLLLNTTSIALLNRPHYFYRTNRPERITARRDATLFDVFDMLNAVVADLGAHAASIPVWANFVWFQNWLLRWLRNQVAAERGGAFDLRCEALAAAFPAAAVAEFRSKFASDGRALEFVNAQMSAALATAIPREAKGAHRQYAATRHLGNDPVGFFNRDPHTFTPDIWGWICLQFGIRSVLDIGCGIGTNLKWFDDQGFDVLGVEGHPRAVSASLLPGKIVRHDFATGPWAPDSTFDLCLCTEFAEHVERQFEGNWLAAVRRCNFLLLSAAAPGQNGYHHVNLQPDAYWVRRIEGLGLVFDASVSRQLRATCQRKPAPWGRNQLMFFRPAP